MSFLNKKTRGEIISTQTVKHREITVITATGDRPQFETVIYCMNRQTVKPDRWIIVDDGMTPIKPSLLDKIKVFYEVIRLESKNQNTIIRNYTRLIKEASGKIIIMEDDDYYPDTYVEFVSKQLDKYDLVGSYYKRIYRVSDGSSLEKKSESFCYLNSTAINDSIRDIFVEACEINNKRREFALDCRLWELDCNKMAVDYGENTPVSLRAWNIGRCGATSYHRSSNGFILNKERVKSWFGKNWPIYQKIFDNPFEFFKNR